MKVTVCHRNSGIPKKNFPLYDTFIKFLQKNFPLKDDIFIFFIDRRVGKMSTGSHGHKHNIKVLTKNRMNRDIMRTLSHEWLHEYEERILKMKHKKDIGGKDENIANVEAGILQKKFEKKYPKFLKIIYS